MLPLKLAGIDICTSTCQLSKWSFVDVGATLSHSPLSCVKTAVQTLQGHILRAEAEAESCAAISGWQERCLRRLPSFT